MICIQRPRQRLLTLSTPKRGPRARCIATAKSCVCSPILVDTLFHPQLFWNFIYCLISQLCHSIFSNCMSKLVLCQMLWCFEFGHMRIQRRRRTLARVLLLKSNIFFHNFSPLILNTLKVTSKLDWFWWRERSSNDEGLCCLSLHTVPAHPAPIIILGNQSDLN